MTHHWDGYGWIIRSLFQYEGLLVVTLFPKHSSLWNHNFQNTFLFPSQLLVLGVQSDELETLSRQKTSDEQRLLMAQSRHDQDFSSSRVEASKQMAAARDIALRQIPDGRDGNHSLPKYVCLAPRHSTSSKSFKRHFLFPAFREWQAERKDPRANAGNFEVGCAEGAMSRFVRVLIIMHSLKLT